MKYLLDEDEDQEVERRPRARRAGRDADSDREITLGTRSLLGIFFALVLICGIFFGLGYSVGRGSSTASLAQAVPAVAGTPATAIAKPSPQESLTPAPASDADTDSSAEHSAPGLTPAAATAPSTSGPSAEPAMGGTPSPAAVQIPKQVQRPAPAAYTTSAVPRSMAKPVAAVPAGAPAQQPAVRNLMIQIAAVSVPQNAEILATALRRHGYEAMVRHEPEDQLLHVEVGPFSTRADAVAMKARLLASGYNAVIR